MEKNVNWSQIFIEKQPELWCCCLCYPPKDAKISETSIIIADGTFKACPEPFEQIYVIFGVFDERTIPLVFAFLEGKTTHHYLRLFEIIKQKIGENFTTLEHAIKYRRLLFHETLGIHTKFTPMVLDTVV